MAELRGLGAVHQALAQKGGGVIAIAVDSPEESAKVVAKNHLEFPILADQSRAVTKAYGLLHPAGGPKGSDIPIPAQFLLGKDGTILWKHVSTAVQDRSDPADLLAAAKQHLP